MLSIQTIKTEYRVNPIGLDEACPRFSWVLVSDQNNTVQASYRLTVTGNDGTIWDTGTVESGQTILVPYAGAKLSPKMRYHVAVHACDNHGETATEEGFFETGLMHVSNMHAGWITHDYTEKPEPCPVFIKEFAIAGEVKSARVYASALGIYELTINGRKAGDAFLAPGWTSYRHRVQYQTYDVTDMLRAQNRVEITVANGWFSGELGFVTTPNHYGDHIAAWAQIEIAYADGREERIITDLSWQVGTGSRRYAELYHGETIDHRAGIAVQSNAVSLGYSTDVLVAQQSEPVRITERLSPIKRIITPKGEVVFDFGQNLTGVVEARLDCPAGTKVVLRHAEVLDRHGNFYTENLRDARATDTFICAGGGEEYFLPAFTFHGFRYVQVEGLGDNPDPARFTACVLHTDMEPSGCFTCSHKGVNRLQQNIRWGQRGNFLDIPTDCPQRNERLGWTGDAQMFASTALYNYDAALFFSKWLRDLTCEQTAQYGVPGVIPNILGDAEGAAAWGDAATIIPWALYQAYGDTRVLEEQYDSMKGWVEYIRSKAGEKHLWQTGFQYGDWVALDKEEGADRTGATDVYLIATAFYAYSTNILARAAAVLGNAADAAEYAQLHSDIVAAFRQEYITRTGRMASETQTACILALHFDLAEPENRARILGTLENNLARHNNHLTTGFVGTPYLCHTLSDNGRHDLAGTVFMKQDYPSWLYCVNLGATTIWERWNSMKQDGSFDESGMNSFNHYAYGSIGNWMYEKLGGLSIIEAGYKKARIAPMPIKGITSVEASVQTPYGEIACAWACRNKRITVDIRVPIGTTAIVHLPDQQETIILGSGCYHYEYDTNLVLEAARYSMESTLGEMLDNPLAVSLLNQFMPGVTDNPMIQFALQQSIAQLTAMMPEGGAQLFEEVIRQCNAAEEASV